MLCLLCNTEALEKIPSYTDLGLLCYETASLHVEDGGGPNQSPYYRTQRVPAVVSGVRVPSLA
jgi:hypothetical protein